MDSLLYVLLYFLKQSDKISSTVFVVFINILQGAGKVFESTVGADMMVGVQTDPAEGSRVPQLLHIRPHSLPLSLTHCFMLLTSYPNLYQKCLQIHTLLTLCTYRQTACSADSSDLSRPYFTYTFNHLIISPCPFYGTYYRSSLQKYSHNSHIASLR